MKLCAISGIAACGGGGGARPIDAAPAADGPAVDTPAPDAGPPPCGYTERADASNDPTDATGAPAAELTELTVGTVPRTLCGTINTGHFNVDTSTVDADAFRVTAATDLVVRFSAAPGVAAAMDFSVRVFTTDDNPVLLHEERNNEVIRDHGAFPIVLPPGTYDVVVSARNAADLAASFDYAVQLAPDGPARCPAVTAPATYTEAADGAGADNDVVAVDFDFDPNFQLTASTTDAPEPTGLTIDSTTPIRITGSSADEDAEDDYRDRDTYLIRTSATTTELTLRLDWAAATAGFDYRVFPAGQTDSIGASFGFIGAGTEDYSVVAVNPDSAYWIWIASRDASTDLPAAYDLTICGASFTPSFTSSFAR